MIRLTIEKQTCEYVQEVKINKIYFLKKNSTSRFLGVSFKTEQGKWVAQINVDKKKKHIGYFDSEILAAKAYDKVAKIHYKEFANLNFKE